MLSVRKQSEYGYGWFIKDWNGSKTIGHGGAIDGFRSMETYFPDKDIYIAALCNSDDDSFFNLVDSIADVAIGKPSETSHNNVKLDQNILDSYSGIYKFIEDTTQFIKVYKEGYNLFADLSNKTGMHIPLIAQTQTFFNLPIIKRVSTTIEFIVEDGKVKGLYWTQEKKHETRKTE